MKKRGIFILMMVLISGLVPGCQKSKQNPDTVQQELKLDRPGTRIGVPEGAAAMTVGEKKYPKAKIVYFNSLSEGYLAVQTKKIDAFLFDHNSM